MMQRLGIFLTAPLVLCCFATAARAQEAPPPRPSQAPAEAFEIGAAAGYAQGFGAASTGVSVGDVAGAAVGIDASVGYRVSPWWSLDVQVEYDQAQAARNTAARGAAASAGVTTHFAPFARFDPWGRIGVGYRMLWSENEANVSRSATVLRQGIELARVEIGVDFQAAKDLALGPVVGADLNMFLWDNRPFRGISGAQALSSPVFNTFVFAGIAGRFDVGGARVPRGVESARR